LVARAIYCKEPNTKKKKSGNPVDLFGQWGSFSRALARREANVSSHTATIRAATAAKWTAAKPVVIGLVIGLIAGPMISGFTGFQIRTSTAHAAARAGIVEQQAAFCAERARAATPNAAELGWPARTELARQWAAMPGTTSVDPDVIYACSGKLST
jgi:hypothetical protein